MSSKPAIKLSFIKLRGNKFLQTHPDAVNDHGLGQFIKNVIKRDADDQLKRKSKQI